MTVFRSVNSGGRLPPTVPATSVRADPPLSATQAPASRARIALPVSLVAFTVAALGSTGREIWFDESVTWLTTTISWAELWRLLGNMDIAHALYYVVMRLWTTTFGASTLALRLPSLIGTAVAAGALALLGRKLYDTTVGVAAGLLFVAIPSVSRYGQEARSYAWVVALAVLATLALTWTLDRPSWRRFLLYGGCLLALTYLHFVAAMVLAAHALMVCSTVRQGRGLRTLGTWMATVLLLALAAAPLLYEASTQSGQVSWITRDGPALARFPKELFGSATIAWSFVSAGLLGTVLLWRSRRALILPLLVWAVAPPVFCYLSYPLVHLFLARFVLFTLPAWSLLAAVAIAVPVSGLRRRIPPGRAVAILAAALVAVAAVGVPGQAEARRSPVAGEADYRAAAALIDRRYEAGDGIAYSGWRGWSAALPMAYQLRTKPRDVFVAVPPGRSGWFWAIDCVDPAPCVGDIRRIWLVVGESRDPFDRLPPARAELLRHEFNAASTDRFPGVTVVLLVRGQTGHH
ncbi:glycosyltransferase family 39 protein [Micromonospora sp. NPDC047548]|uniref:glycosyltransferase family 39 protein n=1 Tax=Micromonospora sp. NPDC047548 TaxID=3155624 RepID=UPI0033CB3E24